MLEMVNGVLNHTPKRQARDAGATLQLSRETLNNMVLQQVTMKDSISSGEIKVQGSEAKVNSDSDYSLSKRR